MLYHLIPKFDDIWWKVTYIHHIQQSNYLHGPNRSPHKVEGFIDGTMQYQTTYIVACLPSGNLT